MVLAAALCLSAAAVAAQEKPPPAQSLTPPERTDPEDRLDTLERNDPVSQTAAAPPPATPDALQQCLARLDALGAVYVTAPALSDVDDTACGVPNPVVVSEAVPGVLVTPTAELRCETAVALAEWVTNIVQPAAQQLPDRGALTGLAQGSAYVCRRRNNAPDGKLSEHAFGNGIDITSFQFEQGNPIRVEPREREGTMAEAFQRTARAGSCLYFTTVLGPGTDAAHADHLHLDVKQRNGGFRLCQ